MAKNHIVLLLMLISIAFSSTAKDIALADYRSFKDKDLYGFKNESGKVVIEPQYEYAFDFVDGIAIVKYGGFFGYINTSNKPITAFVFEKCSSFEEGKAYVMKDGKMGLIDRSGALLMQQFYDHVVIIDETHFACYRDNKVALHGMKGLLTEFKYDEIGKTNRGGFFYVLNEKYGALRSNGKEIGGAIFTSIPHFYESVWKGDTAFYIVGRCGRRQLNSYLSTTGELLIDGSKYDANLHLPMPFMVCESDTDTKVVNIHTGETVIEPTTVPYVKVDWLTCTAFEYDYQQVPYIIFGSEGNYQLRSLEHPEFVCENLLSIPQITDKFIITQTGETSSNLYSLDGKLIVEDAQIAIFGLSSQVSDGEPHRICPVDPSEFQILKEGKVATGNLEDGKLKFKTKGDFGYIAMWLGYERMFSRFERVFYKNDVAVYALLDDDENFYYVYIPGKERAYVFAYDKNASVKIKSVECGIPGKGENSKKFACQLWVTIDGVNEEIWSTYYE